MRGRHLFHLFGYKLLSEILVEFDNCFTVYSIAALANLLCLASGDKQGVLGNACDVQPPPASCTATGGSYHSFRYPTGKKTSASVMIFFSPATEPSLQPEFAPINSTLVDSCAVITPAYPDTIRSIGTHFTWCFLHEESTNGRSPLDCDTTLYWRLPAAA